MNIWHALSRHSERWAIAVGLLYCCVFPGSLIVVALDRVPANGAIFGGILLALQGVSVALWLWARLQVRSLPLIIGIMMIAGIVEYIGATTDIPFGAYDYTTVLGWQIADTVPIVIVGAWLLSSTATWLCAWLMWPDAPRWLRACLAGVCIVVFDLQIEPVATIIFPYWIWHDTGAYYGVPWVNFLGWWLTGTGLAWAGDRMFRAGIVQSSAPLPIPLWHLCACMTMFLVMNARAQHWLAACVSIGALVVVGVLLGRWSVLTDAHRRKVGYAVTRLDERVDVAVNH